MSTSSSSLSENWTHPFSVVWWYSNAIKIMTSIWGQSDCAGKSSATSCREQNASNYFTRHRTAPRRTRSCPFVTLPEHALISRANRKSRFRLNGIGCRLWRRRGGQKVKTNPVHYGGRMIGMGGDNNCDAEKRNTSIRDGSGTRNGNGSRMWRRPFCTLVKSNANDREQGKPRQIVFCLLIFLRSKYTAGKFGGKLWFLFYFWNEINFRKRLIYLRKICINVGT